jgi:hypothetical protein
LIYLVVEYRNKSSFAAKIIAEAKLHSSDSESTRLITRAVAREPLKQQRGFEKYNIASDTEFVEDESMRCTPSYIYPQYQSHGLMKTDSTSEIFSESPRKRFDILRVTPAATPEKRRTWRTRDSLKQIYPSDISSIGPDTSRSHSRPPSYRYMRPSNQNSPLPV